MWFKDDWDKAKDRLTALWDNALLDRACISVAVLKDNHAYAPEPMPDTAEELRQYFTDGAWIHRRQMKRFENTAFYGEAHPTVWCNFGTAGHAKYFRNAQFEFSRNTVWYGPSLKEGEIPEYLGDEGFLKVEKDCMAYLAKAGQGIYYVSQPDNCGILDALAHLRGSNELLMDILDNPEWVQDCLESIAGGWLKSSAELFDITKQNNDGGSAHGWMATWSPGRHQQLQADFSVMISPGMYEEFVLPELDRLTQWLDRSIYHLDGQEQVRHLDMILSLPRLNMVQWTPVAGQPPTSAFIAELRRIQRAGKGLVLFPKKHELPALTSALSPFGLHMVVMDAASEQEARDIVDMVARMERCPM